MSLLKQIAREIFHTGLSVEDALNDLVAAERNAAFDEAKETLRAGVDREVTRQYLIDKGVPSAIATDIVLDAALAVNKERADAELFKRATLKAQTLYRNHVSFADCKNALIAEGCDGNLAEKIARDNQSFYK